jgi:hypothetical protein
MSRLLRAVWDWTITFQRCKQRASFDVTFRAASFIVVQSRTIPASSDACSPGHSFQCAADSEDYVVLRFNQRQLLALQVISAFAARVAIRTSFLSRTDLNRVRVAFSAQAPLLRLQGFVGQNYTLFVREIKQKV